MQYQFLRDAAAQEFAGFNPVTAIAAYGEPLRLFYIVISIGVHCVQLELLLGETFSGLILLLSSR